VEIGAKRDPIHTRSLLSNTAFLSMITELIHLKITNLSRNPTFPELFINVSTGKYNAWQCINPIRAIAVS
jgi:hypothetical protein